MRIDGQGLLIRIYVGESDHWHGQPLYSAIVRFLRERGSLGPLFCAVSRVSARRRTCIPRTSSNYHKTCRS